MDLVEKVSGLKYELKNEQVKLMWNPVENADEYVIRRDGELVSTQSETTFNENMSNDIVTYTVVAKKGDKYSAPSFIIVNQDNEKGENIVEYSKKVSLYPNPTSGILYVNIAETFDAVLYNYQGQVVMREYNNDGKIDMSDLSTGIYFVEIRSGKDVMIEKIIVK